VSCTDEHTDQDDAHLLTLLARDLDQHFADLVVRYEHRLTAYVYYRLQNRQDAEEVVQDVFERVYYALKGYSGQRIRALKLHAWLYTITKNTSYTYLLKRSKTPDAASLDAAEDGSLPEGSAPLAGEAGCFEHPELAYESEERVREIEQAIQALPAYCHELIRLRILEHCSYQEIAGLLNQPIGTVKCYISRGIAILRKNLEEVETIQRS
jgi:RNA polymerase sigma-70 factor (ECF subfamily)